jgi:CRISPR-associated protein Cmr4
MTTRLLFIHALSSLHAGTGQGVGVIDLPIARETATNLPYLPGSSIKGTLRDSGAMTDTDKQVIFGPITGYASDNAGSAQFADARLLLLPVRSLAGTFAWVTSPYVLQRFVRDVASSSSTPVPNWDIADINAPEPGSQEQCKVATGTKLKLTGSTVVLEDLDLAANEDTQVTQIAEQLGTWLFPDNGEEDPDNGEEDPDNVKVDHAVAYWRHTLNERLCIVRDDVLNFLLTTATEVIARVQLQDETKTVIEGALWYEEALPAESVLYSLVVATPVQTSKYRTPQNGGWSEATETSISVQEVFNKLKPAMNHVLQFGGKATVGRGICRAVLVNGETTSSSVNDVVNGDK